MSRQTLVPWPLLQLAIKRVPGKAKRMTEEDAVHIGKIDGGKQENDDIITTKQLQGNQTTCVEDSIPWPRSVGLIKMKVQTELNSRMSDDRNACMIVEMCVTKYGVLLVADMANRRLKAFSPELKFLSFVDILSPPLSVAVINEIKAVVSDSDKHLNFVDISDTRAISITNTIKLDYVVLSVVEALTKIVVIAVTKPKSIKMLDLEGKEIWRAERDAQGNLLFENPEYVASFGPDCHKIVVSDFIGQTLTYIDCNSGKVVKKFHLLGRGPAGLTFDSHNNIYVMCNKSNDVRVFSEDLKQGRVLLAWWGGLMNFILDYLHFPKRRLQRHTIYHTLRKGGTSIAFNSRTSELYVSYESSSDSIDCFKLSLNGF